MTQFWPSMRDRPFYDRIKEMMIQREPDAPEIGSRYITIPNPDYKPAKYFEYEMMLERWNNSYLPIEQRGKKPIKPQPPHKPMTDSDFKQLLINYGVTKNPVTNYDFSSSNTKTNKKTLAGSGSSGGGVTKSSIIKSSTSTNKAIEIYASHFFGMKVFNKKQFILEARKKLKLKEPLSMSVRKSNFDTFDKKHINHKKDDIFTDPSALEVTKKSKAYTALKNYSETDYGSQMIEHILKSKSKFIINAKRSGQATGKPGFITLPLNYPLKTHYAASGQIINPSATIHHEIEHTQFGLFNSTKHREGIGSLKEEVSAMVNFENPARIIDGDEPRYVYYQPHTDTSVSVFDKEAERTEIGTKTFDPKDPRILK